MTKESIREIKKMMIEKEFDSIFDRITELLRECKITYHEARILMSDQSVRPE